MTTREHDVRLADGRTLRVQDAGATTEPTVVFFHGTPVCGLLHDRTGRSPRLPVVDRLGPS